MASKHIRFGMVFEGERPECVVSGEGFFKLLDVVEAQGGRDDGKNFMILTLRRARRLVEVERAMEGIRLVSFENGPSIVTFQRGHNYQAHSIYKIIQKISASGDESFWAWSMVVDSDRKRKRVADELESDLVDASITPIAQKRASKKRELDENQVRASSSFFYGLLSIGICFLVP